VTDARPIGVFDSGIGGLTVLREIRALLPEEHLVYIGDTARVPYGTKGPETVRTYSVNIARTLMQHGCKAIVIACNTASAYGREAVAHLVQRPTIDVIDPLASGAIQPGVRRVLVLGTRGTVASQAYPMALARKHAGLTVEQRACPLFVPLAEEGWTQGVVPEEIARTYLADVCVDGPPDAVLLGCTHYPLLESTIRHVLTERGAVHTTIHHAGVYTARTLAAELRLNDIAASPAQQGKTRVLVTDDPGGLDAVARRFFGASPGPIEHITLDLG